MRKIHAFGASCTFLDGSHKRKLDKRGHPGIYLGVNTRNQGYFVMYASRRQIVTTRNAVIHQTSTGSGVQGETNPISNHEETQIPNEMGEQNRQIEKPTDDADADMPATNELAEATRPTRQRKPPVYLQDYTLTTVVDYAYTVANIPNTYKPTDGTLVGFTDSDWGGDTDDRRSTSRYVFTLGNSAPVSWKTKKQQTVALSSCEAEYMALSEAVKETIYMRSYLKRDWHHPTRNKRSPH